MPLFLLPNTTVSPEENGASVVIDIANVHVILYAPLNLHLKMTSRTFPSNEVTVRVVL